MLRRKVIMYIFSTTPTGAKKYNVANFGKPIKIKRETVGLGNQTNTPRF